MKTLKKKFHIILIKPSKYDDEGYVIRFIRGVLPSNTLACLHGLTEAVQRKKLLGEDVELVIHSYDDFVHDLNVPKLAKLNKGDHQQALVALVGVQSNQFPRASDLAKSFRKLGVDVIIGGFHVSGQMAMFQNPTPEIQELMDAGVSVFAGEAEHKWASILKDAWEHKLQPIYNCLKDMPDISVEPIPVVNPGYLKHFAFTNFGTIDCGRGCPFACSFCTIINVQGRVMRNRSPECVLHAIRDNYHQRKVNYYFFTDDNFSRNKFWEEIFDGLIRLRNEEDIAIFFMMQVDVLSYKIPGFLEKAKEAGCTQVFIGMESINPKNIELAGKKQNKVQDYAHMIQSWRDAGINTHVGYIIGFPFDSPDSTHHDIQTLMNEVKVDQASFFILTPLPGSEDHKHCIEKGTPIETDYNRYDSFHVTTPHPNFTADTWMRAYRDAWSTFYSKENMKAILSRQTETTYWRVFMNFLWYKSSIYIELDHPMIAGFYRLKDRTDRRAGYPVEGRLKHLIRRFKDFKAHMKGYWNLFLEMEEVWLATRIRSEREKRLVEEYRILRAKVPTTGDLKRWYYIRKMNIFSFRGYDTRVHIKWFWGRTKVYWRRREYYKIHFLGLLTNFLRGAKLDLIFLYYLFLKKARHSTSIDNI